jgi:hypothetical protein
MIEQLTLEIEGANPGGIERSPAAARRSSPTPV